MRMAVAPECACESGRKGKASPDAVSVRSGLGRADRALSSTGDDDAENAFAPVTPGEILKEEFLTENGLSQNQLAKAIGISPNRIAEIVSNRRRITADTAINVEIVD